MKKKNLLYTMLTITALIVAITLSQAQAQENKKVKQVLLKNVKIFNGVHEKLIAGDLLVENNLIK